MYEYMQLVHEFQLITRLYFNLRLSEELQQHTQKVQEMRYKTLMYNNKLYTHARYGVFPTLVYSEQKLQAPIDYLPKMFCHLFNTYTSIHIHNTYPPKIISKHDKFMQKNHKISFITGRFKQVNIKQLCAYNLYDVTFLHENLF